MPQYRVYLKGPDRISAVVVDSDEPFDSGNVGASFKLGDSWFRTSDVAGVVPEKKHVSGA